MQSVIQHSIGDAELRLALEQVLSSEGGTDCRIQTLRRHLCPYSSTYPIENLEIELEPGLLLSVIFKDLSPAARLSTAQKVRPWFLCEPWREIEAYQYILKHRSMDTPVFYGAHAAPELEQYWLFLERVDGPLLWQADGFESWELAARWLARFHNEWAIDGFPQKLSESSHILRYDEAYFNVWLTRAMEFLRLKHEANCPALWHRIKQLAAGYSQVVKHLLELPFTVIHGEFYPSNIIMRRTSQGLKVCPVDWESVSLAPGLMDLAALVSGDWDADQKRRLIAVYRDSLEPDHAWPPSLPDLVEAVDDCQLHLAIKMLGWNSNWSPPVSHAHNWLHEAFRLQDKREMLTA